MKKGGLFLVFVSILLMSSFAIGAETTSTEKLRNTNFVSVSCTPGLFGWCWDSGKYYSYWDQEKALFATTVLGNKYTTFTGGQENAMVYVCRGSTTFIWVPIPIDYTGIFIPIQNSCPTDVVMSQLITGISNSQNITSYAYGCKVMNVYQKDGAVSSTYGSDGVRIEVYLKDSNGVTRYQNYSNVYDDKNWMWVGRTVNTSGVKNISANIKSVLFRLRGYNNFNQGDIASYITDCSFKYNMSDGVLPPRMETPPAGKYNVFWASPKNNSTSISFADSGDTVFAFVMGTNSTTALNYTLFSNGVFSSRTVVPPFSGSAANISYLSYIVSSSANYSFNASSSMGINNKSENLTVYSLVDDFVPSVVVDSPSNGNFYRVGSNIWFNQSSYDEDDVLDLMWDFGDGDYQSIEDYSMVGKLYDPSLGNVQHSYDLPGTYSIGLTATEQRVNGPNGPVKSGPITIRVVQPGINVFPIITSPAKGYSTGSRMVLFNASQTYVINCSESAMPEPYFTTTDGGLHCNYIHSPGTYRNQSLPSTYSLLFNWTMGDGNYKIGYWNNTNYYRVVEFLYPYSNSGEHNAKLKVTYEKK